MEENITNTKESNEKMEKQVESNDLDIPEKQEEHTEIDKNTTQKIESKSQDARINLSEEQMECLIEDLTENIVNITAKCVGRNLNLMKEDDLNSEVGEKALAESILKKMTDAGRSGVETLLEIVKEVELNRAEEILEEVLKEAEREIGNKLIIGSSYN